MSYYSNSPLVGEEMRRYVSEDPASADFPSIEIDTKWDERGNLNVTCMGGEARAWLYAKTGRLSISDLDVEPDYRRNGIGKRLLRVVEQEARRRGATYMTSNIVSKECLLAMRSVFGKENVGTVKEGTFEDEDLVIAAEAYLTYGLIPPIEK